MPYLRFTRDRRGYENTYLLHAAYPGERPRVLYWFRTAPDVRVGRAALDQDAIREIESAHPEILFDWSEILEVGATAQPEVEAPRLPRKRTPPRPREEPRERRPHPPEVSEAVAAGASDVPVPEVPSAALPSADVPSHDERSPEVTPPVDVLEPEGLSLEGTEAEQAVARELDAVFLHEADSPQAPPTSALLDELVGRGIATRLRGRYAELSARLAAHPSDETAKEIWRVRIEALNPETWVTAEDVMANMTRADAIYDALRREIVGS